MTHSSVNKVAFTGSTAAGKRIMALCGASVKRVSLELGGKSAAVLLDDVSVPDVVPRIVHGAMHMSGQVAETEGRYRGRPPALSGAMAREARTAYLEQGASIASLSRMHGVSRSAVRTALADLLPGISDRTLPTLPTSKIILVWTW